MSGDSFTLSVRVATPAHSDPLSDPVLPEGHELPRGRWDGWVSADPLDERTDGEDGPATWTGAHFAAQVFTTNRRDR